MTPERLAQIEARAALWKTTSVPKFLGKLYAEKDIPDLLEYVRELEGQLKQALRQWQGYAELQEDRDFFVEQTQEAAIWRESMGIRES